MTKFQIMGAALLVLGIGLYFLTDESGIDTLYGLMSGLGFGLLLIGFTKKKESN